MTNAENGLRGTVIALVGDHRFDYTYQDTGVRVCRQHGAAGYQATCPKAWLRENLPSVFQPEGWFAFGVHVDQPVSLEFSDEVGEDGLPLWERPRSPYRPISPAVGDTHECAGCSECEGWTPDD